MPLYGQGRGQSFQEINKDPRMIVGLSDYAVFFQLVDSIGRTRSKLEPTRSYLVFKVIESVCNNGIF